MVATEESISAPPSLASKMARFAPAGLVLAGLAARLISAHSKFLNADEAMHYLYSLQPSFAATYQASLRTTHPPLLIILLHYWGMISSTEFFLRIPSALGGTAAGWFLYLWLRRIRDNTTALIALALLLFSPALIYTSAEIRQYALLLAFVSATLYFFDCALLEDTPAAMLGSIIALYLALSTHYCALIFALCAGIYGIARMVSVRPRASVLWLWILGQAGGVILAAVFWKTHIVVIRKLTERVAESYLRSSLFHPGEESLVAFLFRSNIRVFHFLFSQGAVAIAGMLLYMMAIVVLLRTRTPASLVRRPSSRQLGMLLLLPFVINCAAALAGVYPYGGTRHNSYLAVFAMPAIAVAVAWVKLPATWMKPVAIAIALGLCNFTVTPAGAYIQAKNQKKDLMDGAVSWIHASVPSNSIILADYESGLLLSYYICHKSAVQTQPPLELFYPARCGDYESLTLLPRLWVFQAANFPAQARQLQQSFSRDQSQQVWLFEAGFIVDREPDFQSLLAQYGCPKPQQFGANIFVCPISLVPVAPGSDSLSKSGAK